MNPWPFLLINWGAVILCNTALILCFKKSKTVENKVLFQTSGLLILIGILLLAHQAFDLIYPDESYEHTIGLGLELPVGFLTFISLFVLGIMGLIEVRGKPRNLLTYSSLMALTAIFLPFFFFIIGFMPVVILIWKVYKKMNKGRLDVN
ncbi:hypothetical protein QWY14_04030 [Planococcus sp. N028]|uniref:DUF4064 domain-containing protein n=1 Tax=Planococcus shixiaomingii TaxID=3058393 RepID=A0ABT8MZ83_9BACL|nr:hypothetical protein [Planococcus sp. N028]